MDLVVRIEIVSNYVLEHLFCGIGELSPDAERISR